MHRSNRDKPTADIAAAKDPNLIKHWPYEEQYILYFDKPITRLKNSWDKNHPDKHCITYNLIDLERGSIPPMTPGQGAVRLYIVGHGDAGRDNITGDEEDKISIKKLATLLAPFINQRDVSVNLIACGAGRGVRGDKTHLTSMAAKLQRHLFEITGKEFPVVGRMTSVIDPTHHKNKGTLNLNISMRHTAYSEDSSSILHQYNSKYRYTINASGEQSSAEVYINTWKSKIIANLKKVLPLITHPEEKKQLVRSWLRDFPNLNEHDIYSILKQEIQNPDTILNHPKTNRNKQSYNIVLALVIDWEHLLSQKQQADLRYQTEVDHFFEQRDEKGDLIKFTQKRFYQELMRRCSQFPYSVPDGIKTIEDLQALKPRAAMEILLSQPASTYIHTASDLRKAIAIFHYSRGIFAYKLLMELGTDKLLTFFKQKDFDFRTNGCKFVGILDEEPCREMIHEIIKNAGNMLVDEESIIALSTILPKDEKKEMLDEVIEKGIKIRKELYDIIVMDRDELANNIKNNDDFIINNINIIEQIANYDRSFYKCYLLAEIKHVMIMLKKPSLVNQMFYFFTSQTVAQELHVFNELLRGLDNVVTKGRMNRLTLYINGLSEKTFTDILSTLLSWKNIKKYYDVAFVPGTPVKEDLQEKKDQANIYKMMKSAYQANPPLKPSTLANIYDVLELPNAKDILFSSSPTTYIKSFTDLQHAQQAFDNDVDKGLFAYKIVAEFPPQALIDLLKPEPDALAMFIQGHLKHLDKSGKNLFYNYLAYVLSNVFNSREHIQLIASVMRTSHKQELLKLFKQQLDQPNEKEPQQNNKLNP